MSIENRIRDLETFDARSSSFTVESYIGYFERGAFDYYADYQRDYVWTHNEQQAFLSTLLAGYPVGSVAIVKHDDWDRSDGPWLEVVDGKQRLMTLDKFVNNEIGFTMPDGKFLIWDELSGPEKLAFGRPYLPMITLHTSDKKVILDFFIGVNFTGVPQSNKHKERVLEMRKKL